MPQFAQQGFFTEITDLAEAAGVKAADYYPFAWEETTYKDGIYALPFDTDTRALWYNKDIMPRPVSTQRSRPQPSTS